MVIHSKAKDLLAWLVPQCAKFPREHRHVTTPHMMQLAFKLHDTLIEARHCSARERGKVLRSADTALDQLRQYLMLAHYWRWLSDGQLAHASELTQHIGRLLGGWRRSAA